VTDRELVEKKLAFILTCVAQLRTNAKPSVIAVDIVQRRFVEHTLQLAIQGVVDVASHIASDERLGEPATNHELLDLLCGAGWIDEAQRATLRAMIGFRNVLVHEYVDVDLAIVRDVVEHRLGELETFVTAIRARIPSG
jgi:uncharacterized protein YutE (UPF0331/DUF86 family)